MTTHNQIMAKLEMMHGDILETLVYTTRNTRQIHLLGVQMSEQTTELDTAVAGVGQDVADLATRIAEPLNAALARIAELNVEIDTLSADDAADQAEIDTLKAERDQLVTDSQENVGKLGEVSATVRGLAQPATPEEPPVEEPTP